MKEEKLYQVTIIDMSNNHAKILFIDSELEEVDKFIDFKIKSFSEIASDLQLKMYGQEVFVDGHIVKYHLYWDSLGPTHMIKVSEY